MLIILPPSESKRPPPDDGSPVDLERLSFPSLTPLRTRILDAVIETSARPDALRRLRAGRSLEEEVARNTALRELPVRPVLAVYDGPLHQALDAATLSPAATGRAASGLIVVSSLWGALRPVDRIPAYRLQVCSRLVGMDRLEPLWQSVLPPVLAEAAGPCGVVVDLRSPSYQAVGMPEGLAHRTVVTRVTRGIGGRGLGDVVAKRTRGEAARHLLECSTQPRTLHELAEMLGGRWSVELMSPERPGQPSTLTLAVSG